MKHSFLVWFEIQWGQAFSERPTDVKWELWTEKFQMILNNMFIFNHAGLLLCKWNFALMSAWMKDLQAVSQNISKKEYNNGCVNLVMIKGAYLYSSIFLKYKLCQISILTSMLPTKTQVWPESSNSLAIKANALQSGSFATKDNLKDEQFPSCV